MLKILACLDSVEMAASRRQELDVPRLVAATLGRSAAEAATRGYYVYETDRRVDWSRHVQAACIAKVSIPPEAPLPAHGSIPFTETRIQVTNETTLAASQRLVEAGSNPLALNFANGVQPGGGFLVGATAQEEVLCRSSALYNTLVDDQMYAVHRQRSRPDSSDWAIYSPDVPIFRTDNGTELEHPWLLSLITCAAPYAPDIGQPEAGDLLQRRIHRVLAIARAYGHSALVLGAWGCGPSATMLTVQLSTFGMLLRMISAERLLTWYLPSQIGRRSGSSLGLFARHLCRTRSEVAEKHCTGRLCR